MGEEVEEGVFETSCKGNGKVNVALHIHVSK